MKASATVLQQRIARRNNSTEAASPKIAGIVDQISQLTLLETADLVSSLKVSRSGNVAGLGEADRVSNSRVSTSPTYLWAASRLALHRLPPRQ